MKKLMILLFITILLAACQSAAAPTPVKKEALASLQPQLYGIWYEPTYSIFIQFSGGLSGPGAAKVYQGLDTLIATANFSFDAGKLIWGKSDYCNDAPATYEITLILENDTVVAMRAKLIGDDACSGRKDTLNGLTYKRVSP
jgi:hypothetical protein